MMGLRESWVSESHTRKETQVSESPILKKEPWSFRVSQAKQNFSLNKPSYKKQSTILLSYNMAQHQNHYFEKCNLEWNLLLSNICW